MNVTGSIFSTLIALAALSGSAASHAETSLTAPVQNAQTLIEEAADEAFQLWLAQQPIDALRHGMLPRRLDDPSPEARAIEAAQAEQLLRRINGINPAGLDLADLLLLKKVRWFLEAVIVRQQLTQFTFPVMGYSSPVLGNLGLYASYPLETAAQRAAYLDLLRDSARIVAAMAPRLDQQAKEGVAIPVRCLDASSQSWQSYLDQPVEAGVHEMLPVRERLGSADAEAQEAFLRAASAILENELNPAIRGYLAAARGTLREGASSRIGMAQYPGGKEAYGEIVRSQLASNVSAEEVHEIGQREGQRLIAAQTAARLAMGHEGPTQDFLDFLRASRPDLVSRRPEDLATRIESRLALVEPELPKWFAHVPQIPFAMEQMPEELQGAVTYGWYSAPEGPGAPGTFHYNGTVGTLMIGAASLAWHEGLPGHHFQVGTHLRPDLALHPLERDAYSSFFGEGWAVYATALVEEMGVIEDPVDRYDILSDAAFMASRLVIDTGLNAYGWSFEEAADYMSQHTGAPQGDINSELLRYACQMPGQALGYYYGSLAIRAERDRAEKVLGSRFDPRDFHDMLLRHGDIGHEAMTLLVDHYIASRQAAE